MEILLISGLQLELYFPHFCDTKTNTRENNSKMLRRPDNEVCVFISFLWKIFVNINLQKQKILKFSLNTDFYKRNPESPSGIMIE